MKKNRMKGGAALISAILLILFGMAVYFPVWAESETENETENAAENEIEIETDIEIENKIENETKSESEDEYAEDTVFDAAEGEIAEEYVMEEADAADLSDSVFYGEAESITYEVLLPWYEYCSYSYDQERWKEESAAQDTVLTYRADERVKIYLSACGEWNMDAVSVISDEGGEIPFEWNREESMLSFIMPECNVQLYLSFVKLEEMENDFTEPENVSDQAEAAESEPELYIPGEMMEESAEAGAEAAVFEAEAEPFMDLEENSAPGQEAWEESSAGSETDPEGLQDTLTEFLTEETETEQKEMETESDETETESETESEAESEAESETESETEFKTEFETESEAHSDAEAGISANTITPTTAEIVVEKIMCGDILAACTDSVGEFQATFAIYRAKQENGQFILDDTTLADSLVLEVSEDSDSSDGYRAKLTGTFSVEPGEYVLAETSRIPGTADLTEVVFGPYQLEAGNIYCLGYTDGKKENGLDPGYYNPDAEDASVIGADGAVMNRVLYYNSILLTKYLGEEQAVQEGAEAKPLAGAVFRMQYYACTDVLKQGTDGYPALGTWYFMTDESGEIFYDVQHLLPSWMDLTSGIEYHSDALWRYDSRFSPDFTCLPMGSLKITEVEAPAGCKPDFRPQSVSLTAQSDEYGNFDYTAAELVMRKQADAAAEVLSEGLAVFNPGETYLCLQKNSARPAVTEGNDRYSLAGAVYEVKDAGGTVIDFLETDQNGAAEKIQVQPGTYTVTEITAPWGFLPDTQTCSVTVTAENTEENPAVVFSLEEPTCGGISIHKSDEETEDGKPLGDASLKGFSFDIINLNDYAVCLKGQEDVFFEPGEKIATLTTDEEGNASSGQVIPYGIYRVIETGQGEGYTPFGVHTSDTVLIQQENEMLEYMVSNRVIRFDIQIIKFMDTLSTEEAGDDLKPAEGCVFEIYHAGTGELVTTITTDADGVASTADEDYPYGRLPYGTYLVHEASCPPYVMPVEDFTITGRIDRKTYTGIYKNDRPVEAPVTVVKTDEESGKIIAGAGTVFQILDAEKEIVTFYNYYPFYEEIQSFTMDGSGTVTLPSKLPYGTYYVHEVNAPEGYLLSEDVKFSVTEYREWTDSQEVVLADRPAKGQIVIHKYDENTKEALAGAEFSIFAAEDIVTKDGTVQCALGELADVITIGEDGEGKGRELSLGRYTVKETKAPDGYIPDEKELSAILCRTDQDSPVAELHLDCYNRTCLPEEEKDNETETVMTETETETVTETETETVTETETETVTETEAETETETETESETETETETGTESEMETETESETETETDTKPEIVKNTGTVSKGKTQSAAEKEAETESAANSEKASVKEPEKESAKDSVKGTAETESKSGSPAASVQTGDSVSYLGLLIVLICSGCVLAVLIIWWRRKHYSA